MLALVTQQKTLLRKLRRDRELSLDLVAFKTGVNVSTISRAERGLLQPSDDARNKLAKFFKVPAESLLERVA